MAAMIGSASVARVCMFPLDHAAINSQNAAINLPVSFCATSREPSQSEQYSLSLSRTGRPEMHISTNLNGCHLLAVGKRKSCAQKNLPRLYCRNKVEGPGSPTRTEEENSNSEPDYTFVVSMQTQHSLINVVDIPSTAGNSMAGARLLLLDRSGNVQSIYYKDRLWTDSYWDDFATFIPLLPAGPVGVLGLAGGSSVRIIRKMWPSVHIIAWEIDQIVVDVARRYLCLEDLEEASAEGGKLSVRIGDALADDAIVDGGFAGLIVDLFSNGQVLPELQLASTWEALKGRMAKNGRIMVNCGGASRESTTAKRNGLDSEIDEGESACRRTLSALSTVFPGEVSVRRTTEADTNVLALTGPICPELVWTDMLPEPMKHRPIFWQGYREADPLYNL